MQDASSLQAGHVILGPRRMLPLAARMVALMSLSAVSTARGAALGVGWVPDLRTNTLNAPRACARAAIRMPALALELTRRPHAPSRSPLRPRRAPSAATPAAAHRRPWRSRGLQWRLQRHCLVLCGSTDVRVLICRPRGWVVCAAVCFCACAPARRKRRQALLAPAPRTLVRAEPPPSPPCIGSLGAVAGRRSPCVGA